MEKYYIGLGKVDTERGWILKSAGHETKDKIYLQEEFTFPHGSASTYNKNDVAEITKEEYDAIGNHYLKEDFDEELVANMVEELLNKVEKENKFVVRNIKTGKYLSDDEDSVGGWDYHEGISDFTVRFDTKKIAEFNCDKGDEVVEI